MSPTSNCARSNRNAARTILGTLRAIISEFRAQSNQNTARDHLGIRTLFAGSDEGGDNWAVIATLIENCKLTGINPHAWLTATLTSLANGHPASRIDELLPHAHVG